MANIRVKDLPNTDTLVDGDELIVDSSSAGTRRVSYGEVKTEIAADYVAAPSTYKVATLAADNKLDPSQIPDTISGGYNFVGVANNVGDLTSTTQGDFYVIQTAFGAYSVGDRAVYDGSAYVRVTDGTVLIEEGGTGAITAATARTNLSVNSIDEDAEATGTKLVGPALYFDGSNDYLEVADDDKFSFTDGTDDLPFSISAWVKMEDATGFRIIVKDDESSAREWSFVVGSSDKLNLAVIDTSGNYEGQISTAALTAYEGQWIHVAGCYGGSGPNSASAFTAAADEIKLYVNGQAVSMTEQSSGTYTGQSDTAQPVYIGRSGSSYAKGHISNVQIFNRELTATEVAQLARGADLGFADEYAGALGGNYTSDFSAGVNGWNTVGTLTLTGNIDSVGPGGDLRDDTLRFVPDATNSVHGGYKSGLSQNKRYRISFDYYVPSTNSNVDSFKIALGSGNFLGAHTATLDAWTSYSVEGVCDKASNLMLLYLADGGNIEFADAGADDTLYIRNVKFTEIGTLADFRAENFDEDTGKLYDLSDNAFVGTSANLPTLTGRAYPVYETGTWTPSLYFSGTSAATYSAQSGYYTRIGNTVYVRGSISVSGVGASSGSVSVAGLPFQPSSDGASSSIAGCYMTSAANLTSQPIGLVYDGVSLIELYDAGATGNTALDETNITASSVIKVSATYQIQ